MVLTKDRAKNDFLRGLLIKADIEPYNGVGYAIKLTSSLPADGARLLIDTRRKEPRVFLTVDAALNTVKDIGFTKITIGAKP